MDYELRLSGCYVVGALFVETVPDKVCPLSPASVFLICIMAPQLWNKESEIKENKVTQGPLFI